MRGDAREAVIGDKQQPNGAEQGEARGGPLVQLRPWCLFFFIISTVPWHSSPLF